MNKPEENETITETADKKNIMQSAKDFMNGMLSPLKGNDIGQLVEDFTAEMTLVAEGLSEDQQKLSQETERLSAQQTELEQRMLDGLHDAEVSADELKLEITDLRSRLEKAENARMLEERIAYTRVSALSGDYIAMFVVDPESGRYRECSSSSIFLIRK